MIRCVNALSAIVLALGLAACSEQPSDLFTVAEGAETAPLIKQNRYMVTSSAFGHDETLRRLLDALDRRDLTVFAVVDHAASAASVELDLTPASLVIFGSPRIGTPLIKADSLLAAELPLRAAVYDNAEGQTMLAITSLRAIGREFAVIGETQSERVDTITRNLSALSAEVTGDQ
ncbi:MAG: DUF302 domain-containing protein [Pseudomonadota bacterium]